MNSFRYFNMEMIQDCFVDIASEVFQNFITSILKEIAIENEQGHNFSEALPAIGNSAMV